MEVGKLRKKRIIALSVLLLAVCLCLPAFGEDTLEKIARTGEFVVGARDSAIPFAFIDANNRRAGFSIDMAQAFHRALEEKLGKSIRLKFVTSTPKTRIPLVANKTIDIECGSTTHTCGREDTVDFSITIFLTGTQLLVKKSSGIRQASDLAGKKVGAAQGSTNEKIIRDLNQEGVINPPARIIVYQDHAKGFLALQQGMLDAYCTDGILEAGLIKKARNPQDFEIVGGLITYDPYAYIVREGDSDFRDFINLQIITMIKDGRFMDLYQKWFGPAGTVPYPLTEEFATLIKLQAWP
jgi:ABC-type amino acid transport substrate-binding protein